MAYMKIEDGKEILVLEKSDFDNVIDLDSIETFVSEEHVRGRIRDIPSGLLETRELLHIEKIILDSILKGEK